MKKLVFLFLIAVCMMSGLDAKALRNEDAHHQYYRWTSYAISKKCPKDKPFFSEYIDVKTGKVAKYKCVSCFEEERMYIKEGHEKDFEICKNRKTISYDKNRPYSVKQCPEDRPLKTQDGPCISCDSTEWVEITKEECRVCGDWRTMKDWASKWYCVLNKSPDPKRPLVDKSVHSSSRYRFIGETLLFPCDELTYVTTTKESCDLCPNRQYESEFESCFLKECPKGYFLDSFSQSCIACDDIGPGSRYATEEECRKCPGRRYEKGRKKDGGLCELNGCPKGTFKETELNQCTDCAQQEDYPTTEAECKKCSNRKYVNGKCVFKYCPSGYFDVESQGWCIKCNDQTAYPTTAEECRKCPNREYTGDECKLKETK